MERLHFLHLFGRKTSFGFQSQDVFSPLKYVPCHLWQLMTSHFEALEMCTGCIIATVWRIFEHSNIWPCEYPFVWYSYHLFSDEYIQIFLCVIFFTTNISLLVQIIFSYRIYLTRRSYVTQNFLVGGKKSKETLF